MATNPDQERARILATLAADAADTADAIREDPTVLNDASWVASFVALWTAVSVLADAVAVIECHAEQPCPDCKQRAYKRTITALPS
jgi:phage portal protein BeeE